MLTHADLTVAALNMAVFLLIGKTSALTMNIAGVVKDWLLIGLSVMLYKSVSAPHIFSLVPVSTHAQQACCSRALTADIDPQVPGFAPEPGRVPHRVPGSLLV